MKKVLLSGVALVALAASPAMAQDGGLELGVSGHFKGYAAYLDSEENSGSSFRSLDIRKETEVHFTGETTLDNGLTVGGHIELNVDRADDATIIEESYLYFSGDWGRVNFGEEDGAAYLMQVAAPSADSNIDGVRQYISSFNYTDLGAAYLGTTLDYAQDASGYAQKITYMTPVFNGFQAGVSYAPSITNADLDARAAAQADNTEDDQENAIDLAVRYEGSFDAVGFTVGAGYTTIGVEADANNSEDDKKQWNVGANVDYGPFAVGASYFKDNNGETATSNADTKVWVLGANYTTGPYKLGLSWYDRTDEAGVATTKTDVTRITGGVVYQYGPGMTFRGAVSQVDVDDSTTTDGSAYQVTVGTQVNF